MSNFQPKNFIEYNVYSVTKIKNKYGYMIALLYEDKSKRIIQKSGFKTKKSANEHRNITISELYNGNFVIYDYVKVKEFFIYWLENEMKPKISACSYDTYKNIVYNHLIPYMGNLMMTKLNRGHIKKFYNEKAKFSSNIARLCKTVTITALDYAATNHIISANVAKEVGLPKSVRKKPYKVIEIYSKKTLNENQIKVLIEKSKETPIYMQVLFAVLMGLRKDEISGLKYSDVDFIHRQLNIQRQLGKKANSSNDNLKKGEYTKQEIKVKTFLSKRELEIYDIVFEVILEKRKEYEKNKSRRINDKHNPFKDYNFICCSTYGNPRSKSFHFKYWKKLLEKNNLPNIRFHDLRATYCTLLVKNNFNLKAISNMMGHSTEIISVDIYADKNEIISDCIKEIEPYILKVIPKRDEKEKIKDFSNSIELDKFRKNINEYNINFGDEFLKKYKQGNFKKLPCFYVQKVLKCINQYTLVVFSVS